MEEEGEGEQPQGSGEEGEASGGDGGEEKPKGEERGKGEGEDEGGEEGAEAADEEEGEEEDFAYDEEAEDERADHAAEEKRDDDPMRQLVRKFQKTISDMEYEPGMERFAEDCKELLETLLSRHHQVEGLEERIHQLETELKVMRAMEADAAKDVAKDKEIIETLKSEVERSRRLADAVHDREQKNVEVTESLRREIRRLNQDLEAKQRLLGAQSDEGTGRKGKENAGRERERLLNEMVLLKDRLASASQVLQDWEARNARLLDEITQINLKLESQELETAREMRDRERVSSELSQIKLEMAERMLELNTVSQQLTTTTKTMHMLQESNNELKELSNKLQKENETLSTKNNKLEMEAQSHRENIKKMKKDSRQWKDEKKMQDEELARLRIDAQQIEKFQESFNRKLQVITMQRDEAASEKERLITVVVADMQRELELLRRSGATDRRALEEMRRERDILDKNLTKTKGFVSNQQRNMKLQEQLKRNLELEIDMHTTEAMKQRLVIDTMERERERLIIDAAEMEVKATEAQEEIKLKQMAIAECKKCVTEVEGRLRQQANLYEVVRADRNAFAKHLLEAQEEIGDLRSKIKMQSHHVEQLKEDISTKENQLLRANAALERCNKDKEALRLELQLVRDDLSAARKKILEMEKEERRLIKIIQDDEEEAMRHSIEMGQAMNERDILGTQLVRRNDELALLYEKIRILQVTLSRGEEQYNQRLEDIRLLKLEVRNLRSERTVLSRSLANMADLRQEVFHLERDLMVERLKVRALEEELQNPLNVHRWRKLQGSDPTAFELIHKVHILQKRVLAQGALALEREAQLREAERLYLGLRHMISRAPGPDVLQRLLKAQEALRDRGRKMKALIAELNMCEGRSEEYKMELDRARQELDDVKKKYFALKKREQKKGAGAGAGRRRKAEEAGRCGEPCATFYGDHPPPTPATPTRDGKGKGRGGGREGGDGQSSEEGSTTGVVLPAVREVAPTASAGRRFTGGGFSLSQPGKGK